MDSLIYLALARVESKSSLFSNEKLEVLEKHSSMHVNMSLTPPPVGQISIHKGTVTVIQLSDSYFMLGCSNC